MNIFIEYAVYASVTLCALVVLHRAGIHLDPAMTVAMLALFVAISKGNAK